MKKRSTSGYTFAEVMVASALIGMAIGGGAQTLATMGTAERGSNAQAVALNLQENAAKLWQLGLSPANIANLMPTPTSVVSPLIQPNVDLQDSVVPTGTSSIVFGTAGTTSLGTSGDMGTVENITATVTVKSATGSTNSSNTVTVLRPTSR